MLFIKNRTTGWQSGLVCLLLLFVVIVGGSGTQFSTVTAQPDQPTLTPEESALLATLRQSTTGQLHVIVRFDVNFQAEGLLSAAQAQTQRMQIVQGTAQVLTLLAGTNYTLNARYETLPFVALTVDEAAFLRLATSPQVTRLYEDEALRFSLASAIPVINADDAWGAGYTGSGQTIAILDSGTQATHPFLGGRVVSEACYSLIDAASGISSACPNGQASQTGAGAAMPPAQINDSFEKTLWSHGTHTAGIAAGSKAAYSGVAKGANIIAIQVASKGNAQFCQAIGYVFPPAQSCPVPYLSNVLSGLERVYALRNTYAIAAVNMSLGGGGPFITYCDEISPLTAAINNLNSVNIASIAAVGNSGFENGIAHPACISGTVAVGATTDGDQVADFSNSESIVDLLAPGVAIESSEMNSTYEVQQGTSMAAPMVAGAWAVAKSAKPGATIEEVLAAFKSTGVPVTDGKNGVVVPRIDVKAAVDALKNGGVKPVRKVVINEIQVEGTARIELYNADTRSADLTGWRLRIFSNTGDDVLNYQFPGFSLGAGAYVTLNQGTGTNTATNLYLGNLNTGWANDGSGAVRLTNGSIPIDFVRWGSSTVAPGVGMAFTDENPPGPPAGKNIGRDEFSTDRDTGPDWTVMNRTLGAVNVVTRPANDLPAGATVVNALPFIEKINIRNATRTGEPTPNCVPDIKKTVWYRIQKAQATKITVQTTGTNFDSALAVYTNITGTPNLVACNDDITAGVNVAARIVFDAQPGVVYHIMAGANAGIGGNLRVTIVEGGFNDEFNDAKVISALPFFDSVDMSDATYAADDPEADCHVLGLFVGASVWYRYTPPSNQTVIFDTTGSEFTPVISVWTGSSKNNLTEYTCDVLPFEISLSGGTTYHIMLNRIDAFPEPGTILNFSMSVDGVQVTPTKTATATATPTGTLTETPTATNTATVDPVPNALENASFEMALSSGKVPDGWIPNNLTRDRRKCKASKPGFAHTGECVFHFTGAPGDVSSITQKLADDSVLSGDTLTIRFWVKTNALSGKGRVRVRVRYTDGTPASTRNIRISKGTYAYTEMTDVLAVANAPIKDVKVIISMANGSGWFRIDDIQLSRAAGGAVPNELRGQ